MATRLKEMLEAKQAERATRTWDIYFTLEIRTMAHTMHAETEQDSPTEPGRPK